MTEFFLTIVNMSICASWIVLAVLLLRLVLKKAPKWITVALWGIVAVRLICPFSIESIFSLIPSAETISPRVLVEEPKINTGISFFNSTINPIIQESTVTFEPEKSVNTLKLLVQVSSVVWFIGVAVMLVYTVISYWRVKRKIGTAVLFRDNIFQSENVVSPFVLGIFKPKIYLPFQINGQDMTHVIAHENAHIRRKDHWWKPLGFLLLSIHWFNPLMWLGYILLCRDIELACDEKVIKEMDTEQKADYSQALLSCSVNRRMIAACPLAFGEVSVKNRIKSVLNYKKPAFWIIIVAIVISLVVGVCFLTNPTSTDLNSEMAAFIEEQILLHHRGMYKSGEFSCADFEVLGKQKRNGKTTVYMWVLYEEYTDDNGKIEDVSGGHIPTAITLRKSNGQYELVEYWEAEAGSRYLPSIRAKFPLHLWQKATDSQRYIKQQQRDCFAQAAIYFASLSYSNRPTDLDTLRSTFPMYFDLSATNGLTVIIRETSNGLYYCGVLPGKNFNYTSEELSELLNTSANLTQMQVIIGSYIANGEVTKEEVTICPVVGVFSSRPMDYYETYLQELTELFWSGVPNAENPIIETTLSYANWSEGSTIYVGGLNRNKMYISIVQHLPIYKFDTLQELERFKEHYGQYHTMDRGYDEVPSFNEVTANYNEAFFADHSLVLVYVGANNSTHRFGVHGIINNDSVFYVQIRETTGAEAVDTAMAGWFITLAVPDEQIKNCTLFDADLNLYIEEGFPEDEENVTESVIHDPNQIVVYEQIPTDECGRLFDPIYTKMHYLTYDGIWHCEGYDYKYQLEVTGRMNNAATNTTYIVLCNESITFDQAWKASGFSSNSEDYFDPKDAIIVGYRSFS